MSTQCMVLFQKRKISESLKNPLWVHLYTSCHIHKKREFLCLEFQFAPLGDETLKRKEFTPREDKILSFKN